MINLKLQFKDTMEYMENIWKNQFNLTLFLLQSFKGYKLGEDLTSSPLDPQKGQLAHELPRSATYHTGKASSLTGPYL